MQRKSTGSLSSKLAACKRSLPFTPMCEGCGPVRQLLLSNFPNAQLLRIGWPPFDFTASIRAIGGNIFTVAIRATLEGNTALPSSVFSATNGSVVGPDGLSTVNAISSTSRRSQFNAIHLSFVEPLLLLGSVSSVSSIWSSHQRKFFISSLLNRVGKSICKNISGISKTGIIDLLKRVKAR